MTPLDKRVNEPEGSHLPSLSAFPSRPAPLTWPQRFLAVLAAALFAGLAGLGGWGSFHAVQDVARPWFGDQAWVVPIGIDVGILALVAVSLLMEWLRMPMPILRWTALAFTAATVWLNTAAAGGDPTGIVMHAAMPVLFIIFVEAVRHAVRRRAGIAAGNVREGIPLARWILAPYRTAKLWRRMVLWQITSYPEALRTEQRRLYAENLLCARYGSKWADHAPADVVWMLKNGVHLDQAFDRVADLTDTDGVVAFAHSSAPPVSLIEEDAPDERPEESTSAQTGAADEALAAFDPRLRAWEIVSVQPNISGEDLGLLLGCGREEGISLLGSLKEHHEQLGRMPAWRPHSAARTAPPMKVIDWPGASSQQRAASRIG